MVFRPLIIFGGLGYGFEEWGKTFGKIGNLLKQPVVTACGHFQILQYAAIFCRVIAIKVP